MIVDFCSHEKHPCPISLQDCFYCNEKTKQCECMKDHEVKVIDTSPYKTNKYYVQRCDTLKYECSKYKHKPFSEGWLKRQILAAQEEMDSWSETRKETMRIKTNERD